MHSRNLARSESVLSPYADAKQEGLLVPLWTARSGNRQAAAAGTQFSSHGDSADDVCALSRWCAVVHVSSNALDAITKEFRGAAGAGRAEVQWDSWQATQGGGGLSRRDGKAVAGERSPHSIVSTVTSTPSPYKRISDDGRCPRQLGRSLTSATFQYGRVRGEAQLSLRVVWD